LAKYKNILIVCTGNTCRSPMAMGLLKKALKNKRGVKISSAGVLAGNGSRASSHAIGVMKEEGIDISGHRSQPLTKSLVAAADLILVMTQVHKLEVINLLDYPGKEIYLLKEFISDKNVTDLDISDPIGRSRAVYRECLEEIGRCLPRLIKKISGK